MKRSIVPFFLFFIVLALTLTSCKTKDDNLYSFELNLNQGYEFTQNHETKIELNQEFLGQNTTIKTNNTYQIRFTVLDVHEDGYTISMVYQRISTKIKMGLISYQLDSDSDLEKATMTDMGPVLREMTNKPIILQVDKKGNVISVQGWEELIQSVVTVLDETIELQDVNEFIAALINPNGGDNNNLSGMFRQLTLYYPPHPVKVGDKWEINTEHIDLSDGTDKILVTLQKVKNNVATLQIEGGFSGTKDMPKQIIGVGSDMDIKISGTQRGTASVDLTNGLMINSDDKTELNNVLSMEGVEVPQKMKIQTHIQTY